MESLDTANRYCLLYRQDLRKANESCVIPDISGNHEQVNLLVCLPSA